MTPLEEEEIAGAINDLWLAGDAIESTRYVDGEQLTRQARKRLERLVEPQDTRETVQGHE